MGKGAFGFGEKLSHKAIDLAHKLHEALPDHESSHRSHSVSPVGSYRQGKVESEILQQPSKNSMTSQLPVNVKDFALSDFDPGVLDVEMLNEDLYLENDSSRHGAKEPSIKGNITQGTYGGTQAAITHLYSRIEQKFASYFDVLGVEPTLPQMQALDEKKRIYQWSAYPTEDGKPSTYPPHLKVIPDDDKVPVFQIFNALGLLETQAILIKVVPDTFIGNAANLGLSVFRQIVGGSPEKPVGIEDIETFNRQHLRSGTDIKRGKNVGHLTDWYTDRRFADQQFTGTNPTTIKRASTWWVQEFVSAAKKFGDPEWVIRLSQADPTSLFVQDNSYFRKAVKESSPAATLHVKPPGQEDNWCVASVSLFQLHDDGQLHPVAICIDYLGSLDESVVIFNKRKDPSASTATEAEDWPWRYAKTCAQVSDWVLHELGVHLTHAHYMEEAMIVATNRTIPMDHPVYKILSPHWYKTLSLNAAARATLIPQVVLDIIGLDPEQASSFIKYEFENFNWEGNYIPNNLAARGFPNDENELNKPKYKDYAYGKNMLLMWKTLRRYVESMLRINFPADKADDMVKKDSFIRSWGQEVRDHGYIRSFPDIQTFEQLVDAVTMCIHVAAPLHTAVNYLQNFYQGFVIAKPSMLCRPPPSSLGELQGYKEADLIEALPIGNSRQRQWLLASQVPWLLSFKVAEDRSLLNFAASQFHVYKYKTKPDEKEVAKISAQLWADMRMLSERFNENSARMTPGAIPYTVMDPANTAVSILI